MGNFIFHFLTLFLLLFRPLSATSNVSELFEIWCTEHGKSYSSAEAKLYRLSVFADNYEFVTHHNNLGNSSYTLSLNSYADLTHHEFKVSRLGFSPALPNYRPVLPQEPSLPRDVPDSVDWRKKGAVTAVKDQGSCGACWSFSATGAMEGINQIMTGSLISLSEQELIDCDKSYNLGCRGGSMARAYQFVISNHGIDAEDDYPYQGRDGLCRKDKLKRNVVTIDGYTYIPSNDEGKLLQAVAAQPVSVSICGSDRAFQLYSKGIFSGPCSTSLDHGVLIVGYGSENGVDYWIVKNSWGRSWGMDGYMHMQRNSGNAEGLCGINKLASYPTKTNPNPPPGPTKCSAITSCGVGETCCCAKKFFDLCLSWKCCALSAAVCCKDGSYCCPLDYPICDNDRNQCLKRTMNGTQTEVLENRSSSVSGTWSSF